MILSTKGAAARLPQLQAKLFTQSKLQVQQQAPSPEQSALTTQISDLGKRLIGFGKVMDGIDAATSQVRSAASRSESVRDLIDEARYLLVSARENAASGTVETSETTTTDAATTGGTGLTDTATLQSLGMSRSRSLTVGITQNGQTTNTTLSLSKSETVSQAVSRIDGISGISASLNSQGALEIKADSGVSFSLSDNGSAGSSVSALSALKLTSGDFAPQTTTVTTTTSTGPQIDREALAARYNEIMTRIDDMVGRDDGANLLRGGTVSTATREKGDYFSVLPGEDISRSKLGLDEARNAFAGDDDIDAALKQLDGASDTVLRVSAGFDKEATMAELWQGFQSQMADQLYETYQKLTEKQAMEAATSARAALTGQFSNQSLTGTANLFSSF